MSLLMEVVELTLLSYIFLLSVQQKYSYMLGSILGVENTQEKWSSGSAFIIKEIDK